MKYNLSSNMAHRVDFDAMVERTLEEAQKVSDAECPLGEWENYFDLDAEGFVDDKEEAAARIESIWPV